MDPDAYTEAYERLLSAKARSKAERSVRLHGKEIDGVRYIKVTDVVDMLVLNDVLPGIVASLKRQIGGP